MSKTKTLSQEERKSIEERFAVSGNGPIVITRKVFGTKRYKELRKAFNAEKEQPLKITWDDYQGILEEQQKGVEAKVPAPAEHVPVESSKLIKGMPARFMGPLMQHLGPSSALNERIVLDKLGEIFSYDYGEEDVDAIAMVRQQMDEKVYEIVSSLFNIKGEHLLISYTRYKEVAAAFAEREKAAEMPSLQREGRQENQGSDEGKKGSDIEKRYTELCKAYAESQLQCSVSERRYDVLVKKHTALKELYHNYEVMNASLQTQCEGVQKALDVMLQRLENENSKIQKMKEEKEELTKNYVLHVNDLQMERDNLKGKLSEYRKEQKSDEEKGRAIQKQKEQIGALNKQVREQQAALVALRQEKQALEERIEEKEKIREEEKRKKEKREKKKEKTRSRKAMNKQDAHHSKEQEAQKAESEKALIQLRAEKEAMLKQQVYLQDVIARLQEENKALRQPEKEEKVVPEKGGGQGYSGYSSWFRERRKKYPGGRGLGSSIEGQSPVEEGNSSEEDVEVVAQRLLPRNLFEEGGGVGQPAQNPTGHMGRVEAGRGRGRLPGQ